MTTTPPLPRPLTPWSRWSVRVPFVLAAVLVGTLAVLVLAGQDLDQDALHVLVVAAAFGTTVLVRLLWLVDDVRATPRERRSGPRSAVAYAVFVTGSAATLVAGLVVAFAVGLTLSAWLDDNFLIGPSTLTLWETLVVYAAALAAGCLVAASGSHTSAELALRIVRGRRAASD